MVTRRRFRFATLLACGGWLVVPALVRAQDDPAAPADAPQVIPADEAPDPVEVAPPDEGPPPLVELPTSLREGWGWMATGPRVGLPMSDVTAHPDDPEFLAAVSLEGEVWLSLDRGGYWFRILKPISLRMGEMSSDEEVMREFESQVEDLTELPSGDLSDLLDEVEDQDELDAIDDLVDEVQDAASRAAGEIRSELRANPDYMRTALAEEEQRSVLRGELATARPQVWITEDDVILVGRVDGLRASDDLGASWHTVIDIPVTALEYLPERGLWVAGSQDGMRYSTDLVSWIDPLDGTEELHVFDLASAPEGMYAGTSSGLLLAPDAQAWRPAGPPHDPVFAVLTDPDWDRGLWFANARTVFRSDEGGSNPREALGAPLHGVLDMHRLGPGRLVLASADGPWESMDGGTTWAPLPRGLADPTTRALVLVGAHLFLASDEGVFWLVEMEEETRMAELPAVIEEWVPVDLLIDAAISRHGMREHQAPFLGRIASTALPRLQVEGRYNPGAALRFDRSSGTVDEVDGLFFVQVRLTWVPDGRKGGVDLQAMVVDGEVLVDDGRDRSFLSARVNRKATDYRRRLIKDVSELYFARAALVAGRDALARESLEAKLEHEIRIQELEAQLDVFTDGSVSRHVASQRLQE
ncbi:MAG: hypothetical protein JRJ84_05170 [Deltaproteobacteria bacterium]|nr:hypothetical protein [Deltaproteobacteria bacterium]